MYSQRALKAIFLTAMSLILITCITTMNINVTNGASGDSSIVKNGKWLKDKLQDTANKVRDTIGELRGPVCPIKAVGCR